MNRSITLAARPEGYPRESDFQIIESPIADPENGEILVRADYLSVDPYMRGRMNDSKSYAAPIELGDVMVGESVGCVIRSKNDRFQEGDYVAGMFGWQEYAISNGQVVRKLNPEMAPISTALHVLGMPGMTAYFGLFDVCQAKAGDSVLVSGAAGAVGSVVGQLAKLTGCHVVGVAGSDEKISFLTGDLGFDAGLNYKTTDNYYQKLKELCPAGIDTYFDNVGGPITDNVFPLLNVGARIAICGQISQYNVDSPQQGPRVLWNLIIKRAKVQGFLVTDYHTRYREAMTKLTEWFVAGQLTYRERISDGIESAPRAFIEMMQGANIGKQLVKLSAD